MASDMDMIPNYLTDDTVLVRKFLESKYDSNVRRMNMLRGSEDFSFEQATVPETVVQRRIDDLREFVVEVDIPDHWWSLGAMTLWRRVASRNLSEFVDRLKQRYEGDFKAFNADRGGGLRRMQDKAYGALRAIDPVTGERKWEFKYPTPTMAGVMSTASGLVFAGDNEGNFSAFDATTGKPLWHYPTGSSIWGAAPMTYMLDGRQYVIIASGSTLVAFALPPA